MSASARWARPFSGLRVEHPREPAPAQLLDRADVDHPVVQVRVELGHVAGEEAAVGGDRVAGQGRGARLGDVLADVGEHALLGLAQRHRRPRGPPRSARSGRACRGRRPASRRARLVGVDDESTPSPSTRRSPSVTRAAISMSASRPQVEAGHLAVDPHQTVVHPASLFATLRRRGRRHECDRGSSPEDRRRVRDRGRRRWSWARSSSTARSTRRPGCASRWRCSTGTASSPARPVPARRRRCRRWPSSCPTPGCRCCSPTSRATCPGWRGRARTTRGSSRG